MRKKQFVILLMLLVLIIAAIFGIKAYQTHQEKATAKKQKEETVYVDSFDPDKVTAFSYQNNGKTLKFVKEDEKWQLEGKSSVALDSDSVQSILDNLSKMTAENTISDVKDTSEYGLDQPVQTVAIVFADGSTKTLVFGMENQITGGYYVQADKKTDLYLVDSSYITSTLNKSTDDLKAQESSEDSDTDTSNTSGDSTGTSKTTSSDHK